jgi:Protein of unknown function (DUF550)
MIRYADGLSAWPRSITAIDLMRQRRWSYETFGPDPRTAGILSHIRKELDEILEFPTALDEWVDVMILAVDGASRAGHSPQDIVDGYLDKMEINYRRSWPDWQGIAETEPIEHVRD